MTIVGECLIIHEVRISNLTIMITEQVIYKATKAH